MKFCYDKLNGRIVEVCGTKHFFAKLMDTSPTTVSAKTNNKSEFTQSEILQAVSVLNLSASDIPDYFFTPLVQKN